MTKQISKNSNSAMTTNNSGIKNIDDADVDDPVRKRIKYTSVSASSESTNCATDATYDSIADDTTETIDDEEIYERGMAAMHQFKLFSDAASSSVSEKDEIEDEKEDNPRDYLFSIIDLLDPVLKKKMQHHFDNDFTTSEESGKTNNNVSKCSKKGNTLNKNSEMVTKNCDIHDQKKTQNNNSAVLSTTDYLQSIYNTIFEYNSKNNLQNGDDAASSTTASAAVAILLPFYKVLMSISHMHLANTSIDTALNRTSQEEDDEGVEEAEEYLKLALQYCPWNVRAMIILANYYRIQKSNVTDAAEVEESRDEVTASSDTDTVVLRLYEQASKLSNPIRKNALTILEMNEEHEQQKETEVEEDEEGEEKDNDEEENEDNVIINVVSDVNEWIEILFLNEMLGVEYLGDDDDDENDSENEDEDAANEKETEVDEDMDAREGLKRIKQKQDNDDSSTASISNTNSSNKEEYSTSSVQAMANFMCSMLHSTANRHHEALPYLQTLNITHRIHPDVWNHAITTTNTNIVDDLKKREGIKKDKVPHPLCCYHGKNSNESKKSTSATTYAEGVLPQPLYKSFKKLFAPNGTFWNESDYKSRGYYSFWMDLPTLTNTESNGDNIAKDNVEFSPQNAVEDVIYNHLLPLVQDELGPDVSRNIVGAEWWAHTRPTSANLGHQLHFDTDEAHLKQTKTISHPIVSSVLYITGGKNGSKNSGSTIIFDQSPETKTKAEETRCWFNKPKNNSFLMFPGNLLHGVLPCPKALSLPVTQDMKDNGDNINKDEDRLTFMVGFWTRRADNSNKVNRNLNNYKNQSLKSQKPHDPLVSTMQYYTPCGPIPPRGDENHSWVDAFAKGYNDNHKNMHSASNYNDNIAASQHNGRNCDISRECLSCVFPAWECIVKKENIDSALNSTKKKKRHDAIKHEQPTQCLDMPPTLDHRYFVKDPPTCFYDSLFKNDEYDNDEENI